MKVEDIEIDLSKETRAQKGLFDTGTSLVVIADAAYNTIHDILLARGCYVNEVLALYPGGLVCPCAPENINSYPNITYYMRGVELLLTSTSYLISGQLDDVITSSMCHKILNRGHAM